MPKAPVNGNELYYEVHGRGPETVVFAHGAGGNHLSWWQQIPIFANRYRCVTFDHRGFGLSADDPSGPGRSAFVDDLHSLLAFLGIDEAYLVAQSMGGQTALGFTLRYPQRVKALVMADTVVGMRDAAYFSLDSQTRAELRQAREQRRNSADGRLSRALGRTCQSGDPLRVFLYRQIAALNPRRPSQLQDNDRNSEVTPAVLALVKTPVLFLVGEEDEIFPPVVVQAAQGLIPGAQLVVVPQAGHSVYFERPEAFNAAVLDFFATVAKGELEHNYGEAEAD